MPAVDLAAQALKALAPRSPFDSLDSAAASSSSALPSSLAAAPSDPRCLRKKSAAAAVNGGDSPRHSRRRTVWESTAAYFSAVSSADVDLLTLPAVRPADPSFTVPVFGSSPASPPAAPSSSEVADAAADVDVRNYTPSSISWLLGCRGRCHLTSERPNKKRRLLGTEAGLEQLLKLPYLDTDVRCDFCCLGGAVVRCGMCKVTVHRECYGVGEGEGDWLCSWCEHWRKQGGSGRGLRQCVLCPREGGAVKPVAGGAFAHLFCCMWTPEVYVEDVGSVEPILNVEGVNEARRRLVCNVCKVKHGFCVRCSEGTCRTSFHPLCARESKLRMEVWGKFGCDNVELRAFCSKHSGSHGNNSAKRSGKFRLKVAQTLSLAKPPPVILPVNTLHKIRPGDGVRYKSMAQGETTGSEDIVNNEFTMVDDCEAQLVKGLDTYGIVGSGNKIAKEPTLALLLRKLIEQGRVNINDVASEMGIASNSLKAALVGQTSSFSPGLALKLMQWLQNHGHSLRRGIGSAIPLANGVSNMECLNVAKVSDPLTDVKTADHDAQIPLVVESLPPSGRTNSNTGILEYNKTCPSAVEVIKQNGSEMLVDETGETQAVLLEDIKKESHAIKSFFQNQGSRENGLDLSETILEGMCKLVDHNSPVGLIAESKGNSMEMESTELSESNKPPYVTGVSTCEPSIHQVDTANTTASLVLEKDCCVDPDCDNNPGVSSDHLALIDGETGSSYVHPFIQRRLMQVQVPVISMRSHTELYSVDDDQNVSCSVEADTLVTSNQEFNPLPTDTNHAFDAAKLDQLAKAKNMGILELSPEDEVEEELLYLQSRLLDKAVAIKHKFEALLPVVVENLPKELDMLNKRRWDMVHVTQFLCEVREAKKQGRKERKHKEAQAVLAAAVAAASPRISSQRKYVFDEIISTQEESRLNVSSAAGRARVSPLGPQAKMFLRVAKVSQHTHSGSFQLPEFPQENAFYCDICRRAETSLNRIFVYSCCKVAVHIDCYRTVEKPIVSWKCELCEEITSLSRSPINGIVDCLGRQHVDVQCGLCAAGGGAFRKSTDGQWVHAFCAEWLLESRYERGQQDPVDGMDINLKEKDFHSCCICHRNVGACLKCSCGHCQITFHPSCARSTGLYMNVKSIGGKFQHQAYCEKHSLEQIEADRQQHGFEDLKTVKRLRVELEKVRLLCERIIKREKLKRDLIMCSHEVLASQRDYVAFSLLAHSSYIRPGASSESATTSVDNRSFSDAVERSDDITVDSTVSGEQSVRFSMNTDADRKTDDSSTSQLSCKLKFPKISNRGSFGAKQLPRRPASAALWNSAEDGEKMSNAGKRTQTFQEWALTSKHMQMQNQRHLKGFAYGPVVSPPNETSVIHDMESCVPPEPGG